MVLGFPAGCQADKMHTSPGLFSRELVDCGASAFPRRSSCQARLGMWCWRRAWRAWLAALSCRAHSPQQV